MTADTVAPADWDRYAGEQAEHYLMKVRGSRRRARYLMQVSDDARQCADGVKAARVESRGIASRDADAKMMHAIESLTATAENFADQAAATADLMDQATGCIAKLDDDTLAQVLFLYYVKGAETWQDVADDMIYSVCNIYKLRVKALTAFYYVMPHTEREPMQPAI